ncbi:substrate-binding domain-containing protein [Phytohabitans flavus]|uniref:substrate-binding domain-containing protein n=1 Tax=Phytohabitans flavus TaxID=1076124 RepID=UPI00362DC4D8
MGYSGPNPTARSLRSGRAGAIGVLFTTALSIAFTDPYAVQFLRGLAEVAEDNHTGLLLVPLRDDDEGALEAVRNAAVDGFVVYCVPAWYRAMEAAWARGIPVVNSDRLGSLYVGIDEVASTRAAGEHLMRFGHRRVAIIADYISPDRRTGEVSVPSVEDLGSYVSRERLTGYRDAFAAAGLDWSDVITISSGGNSREFGAAAAAYALDRSPRPTAVVATTDLLALGVLDALAARDLRPGRDVSVIGFDDIPDAAHAHMTTVRQPALERGRVAGRLLLDPPDDPTQRRIVLPTELIVRASTGPVPTGSI